ncbi:hypothetical protein [Nocardia crassostreae]|uniref:hypothetical protein n=1 Tax=Nocardia crassostreae TaxID=53428 RepID=UPI0012FCC33B|nr:hypothetical protein [Nocardia crassostreae]
MKFPIYYSYFNRPLRVEKDSEGHIVGFIINSDTGHFEPAVSSVVGKAMSIIGHPEIWELERDEFIVDAERVRADFQHGSDPAHDLYAEIDGLLEVVSGEDRAPT